MSKRRHIYSQAPSLADEPRYHGEDESAARAVGGHVVVLDADGQIDQEASKDAAFLAKKRCFTAEQARRRKGGKP